MGTRHLICIVKDGEYKLAQYGQWDGYPSGQGVDILKFLLNENNQANLLKGIDKLYHPSKEEIDNLYRQVGHDGSEWISMDKADEFSKLNPSLSRDCGSDILNIIATATHHIPTKNSIGFASDSLFCEWVYVIDFDKNTLEVYEGFNESPLSADERFYSSNKHDGEYYPVKHSFTWKLNELPSEEDFLSKLEPSDEEGEEEEIPVLISAENTF